MPAAGAPAVSRTTGTTAATPRPGTERADRWSRDDVGLRGGETDAHRDRLGLEREHGAFNDTHADWYSENLWRFNLSNINAQLGVLGYEDD